jgi:hypothetical protein
MNRNVSAALVLLGMLGLVRARAQNNGPFALTSSTIGSGGGASSGGPFTVSGTIGQPTAGVLTGGNFKLEGGFWSGVTVVQTPGAPSLKIKLIAGHQAVISWPITVIGWALEETTAIGSGVWSATPQALVDAPSEHTISVPAAGNKCYRLKKQTL